EDQAVAGAIMWVSGSLAYLVPLVLVVNRLLKSDSWRYNEVTLAARQPVLPARGVACGTPTINQPTVLPLPILATSSCGGECSSGCGSQNLRRFDLLRVPFLGRLLR